MEPKRIGHTAAGTGDATAGQNRDGSTGGGAGIACADTSFLLSLAGNDSNSPAAVAHAKTLAGPIIITALSRWEFENAIALLRFRREMPEAEATAAATAFAADEASRRITETVCDWPGVMMLSCTTEWRMTRTRSCDATASRAE